ncbi:MAG: lipopolysaccharide assembly LapA domain-containing protein [Pseudomonadota bacterium]|jgi:uncharacterized integral membrane protein
MPLAPEAPGRRGTVGMPVADPERRSGAFSRLAGWIGFAFKVGLFVLVFAFALRNNEPVTLRLLPGQEWSTSLALALVGALCVGALLGVLAMSGHALKLRRRALQAEADVLARASGLPPARSAGHGEPPGGGHGV